MKGSITKDYSAYKLTTNASVQDLAFVFGEGVADEKYVSLKVSWIEQAKIEIIKKDDTADVNLAGAVFGVYSDEACTKLITQMPATDKKWKIFCYDHQDTGYRLSERNHSTTGICSKCNGNKCKTGSK